MGSIPTAPTTTYAQVAQWQEAIVLGTIQCQFESDLEYHDTRPQADLVRTTYLICLLTEHEFPLNYHWQDATKEDRRLDMWLAVGRAVNK